jgi:hypothetical protein
MVSVIEHAVKPSAFYHANPPDGQGKQVDHAVPRISASDGESLPACPESAALCV